MVVGYLFLEHWKCSRFSELYGKKFTAPSSLPPTRSSQLAWILKKPPALRAPHSYSPYPHIVCVCVWIFLRMLSYSNFVQRFRDLFHKLNIIFIVFFIQFSHPPSLLTSLPSGQQFRSSCYPRLVQLMLLNKFILCEGYMLRRVCVCRRI